MQLHNGLLVSRLGGEERAETPPTPAVTPKVPFEHMATSGPACCRCVCNDVVIFHPQRSNKCVSKVPAGSRGEGCTLKHRARRGVDWRSLFSSAAWVSSGEKEGGDLING